MDEPLPAIGLPPRAETAETAPTPSAIWKARGVNLFGLVSPAANLGLVFVAKKEHRWFGFGAGVAAAGVTVWAANTDRPRVMIAALGVHYALVLLGLVHPLLVTFVARAWLAFSEVLGKVMAYPVFGAVYFLVVTPTGLLLRASGRDPLRRKAPPGDSYWTPHRAPDKARYERQF